MTDPIRPGARARLQAWLDDFRFAARGLWKTKGFTIVAVLCLALGIGGTTAIFSVVQTVLWSPLPFPQPDRLAQAVVKQGSWSLPIADIYAEGQSSFESVGGIRPMRYNLTVDGQTLEVDGAQTTPGLFEALGLDPVAGRLFVEQDDRVDADPVALVSARFAQRRFEQPGQAVGQAVLLDGDPYEVVGVLPTELDGVLGQQEVFVTPSRFRDTFPLNHVGAQRFRMIGRLAPAGTLASAQAEIDLLPGRLEEELDGVFGSGQIDLEIERLDRSLMGEADTTIWTLMAAVLAVLLIACANVANLLLTRGTTRAREIAVRQAIGASRGVLVRQQLAEGLLLATLGAAGGLLVASWGVYLLSAEATELIPMVSRATLNPMVLAFSVGVTVVSALTFSLLPALASAGEELTGPLQAGGLSWRPRGRRLAQGWIVGLEVALALVLIVGAGLSLRSVRHLAGLDLGFEPQGAVVAAFELPPSRYRDDPQRNALGAELVEYTRSLAGVRDAGLVDMVPLMPASGRNTALATTDLTATPLMDLPRSEVHAKVDFMVGEGALEAMGVRVVRGRLFEPEDYLRQDRPVILDEAIARSLFGGEDPIGRQFRDWQGVATVVGVVAPVRNVSVIVPEHVGVSFYPQSEPWNRTGAGLVVRSEGDLNALGQAIRDRALELDAGLPAFVVEPYDDAVLSRLSRQRLLVRLLGLFAIVAATMAGVGIFGVMSYAVQQRTHEIGVRMALGAPPTLVVVSVVRDALWPVGGGVLVGVLGSVAASRVLESMIYGVETLDGPAYAMAIVGILATAAVASYLPVRRAVRIPPMSALRQE